MQRKTYTSFSKAIHWLIALVVIPMVLGSFYLESIAKPTRGTAIMLHKSFGLTILALMLIRLIYIHRVGHPSLPSSMPDWEKRLSRVVQYSLYVCLLLMPMCGWIMATAANYPPVYFNWFTLPFPFVSPNEALSHWMFQAHHLIAYCIILLLGLHIAGALKHHLIDRDDVLKRML